MTLVAPETVRWDLSGRYQHPHWLAHLCTRLAERGVSVTAGQAVRRTAGEWEGHLLVDLCGAVVATTAVDLPALAAASRGVTDVGELRLSSVRLARLAGGFLELRVTAPDEIGFLGRILRRVAVLGLHPVEVSVATRSGAVTDVLVLAGIGATRPSEDVGVLLEQVMRGHLVR